MADLAPLGVVVKTSGVPKAESDLRGLTREGERADARGGEKDGARKGPRVEGARVPGRGRVDHLWALRNSFLPLCFVDRGAGERCAG